MPSAFTTMNAASRGSLEDIVKQRIVEAKLAEMQQEQQRQMAMDAFNMNLRLRGAERAERGAGLARQKFDADVAESKTKAERATRDEATTTGLRSMFNEGLGRGADPIGLTQIAVESGGKIPLGAIPKPPTPKPSREERTADIKADVLARREAGAQADKQWPKPTKASKAKTVKDSPVLPAGVKSAIEGKKGQPGWTTAADAAQSVKRHWPTLRKDHPGLDLGAVMGFIENVYGSPMTAAKAEKASAPGIDSAALRERIKARLAQ